MSSISNTDTKKTLPISGVVLAGGRSRRFSKEGQDKAKYIYKNKRMLDWSLESLSETNERFIIANQTYETDFQIYKDLRTDCTETGCGPLGGLYTALKYANHDWVALAACDMPNLTPIYWQQLFEQMSDADHAIVIKSNDKRLQTLAALYHKSLLPMIETHLDKTMLSLQSLSEHFSTIEIDDLPQNQSLSDDLFLNFNYLEDIDQNNQKNKLPFKGSLSFS